MILDRISMMNRFSIGVAIAILAMAAPRATLAQSPASSLRTSAEARFGSPSPQPGEGSGVKGTSDRVAESKDQPKSEPEARPKFEKKLEESPTVLAGPVETRRLYRVSLGPWSRDIEVPDSIDLFDIADRIRAFVGMLMILGVAVFLSENRRAISGRVVFWGLALQWGFALLVLRVPAGIRVLARAGDGVKAVLDCALEGASFVFGKPLVDPEGPAAFVFAFRVLPTVIFVAALFAVLYHLGVMQWIVRAFAVVMAWCMGTSGAESLDVAASLFLGQTEAPLTIRPYLARLTRSELLTVMTAPGAIMLSKLLVPETGKPETLGTVSKAEQSTDANVLDAAARGTRDGLHLALNIAAVLISFLALVALVNMGIPYIASAVHYITGWTIPNTLQGIVGWAMAPVAYMLGVPWEDCKGVGVLLGTRTVLNELIAYKDLGDLKPLLIDRSFIIASFALCGFANISSIGIQLGGIGALAPERRHDLARLGVRALFAGTLANYLSACIAGILL
jgi:CNT family concentrative nucleoside transporter